MKLKTFEVDPKTQKYRFNDLLLHVRPYYLVPLNSSLNPGDPEQIDMAGGGVSAAVQMYIVDEGAFEGALLSCHRTAACLIDLYDDVHKRHLTGRPCHVDTIFGTGQEPFILPESIFLEKRHSLQVQATDLSGQANEIRLVIGGQRIFSDRIRDDKVDQYIRNRILRARYMLPYLCPLDTEPVLTALQANVEHYFTQDAVGHFDVRKITFSSSGDFKFRIIDETGQEITGGWVHSAAGLGTGAEPYIFYSPFVIRAGGVVRFIFTDLSDAENTIYMTLSGRLTYL